MYTLSNSLINEIFRDVKIPSIESNNYKTNYYNWQKEDNLNKLKLSIPGYEKTELDISYNESSQGRFIFIKAENKEFGELCYKVYLPKKSDPSTIKSSLKNGVLYISVQEKNETSKIKQIQIE